MPHNILYIDSTQGLYGGGQISLLELLKQLNKSKFTPVAALGERGKLLEGIERIDVPNKIIPMPAIRPYTLVPCIESIRILKYLIRSIPISLVHTNTSRATIYAYLAARRLGVSIIWHARIPHSDRFLDRFLSARCSRIIAVSQAVKRRFNWLQEEKIRVIYNGVDTKRFAPGLPYDQIMNKFNLKKNNVVIGTVGRISPEKGLEFLISATKDVVKVHPQAKILIVGEGNTQYLLALQAKVDELNLSSHVIFAGFHNNIPEVLRSIDIFCLPSLTEGFNRTLLEAMACGLPIVATEVGGNVEIIKDGLNGLLVPPRDSAALSSAIVDLLNNKSKARRIGTEARRIVEKSYSIETSVRQTEALYEEIIATK